MLYSLNFAFAHAQIRLLCISEFVILVLHYYARKLFYHLNMLLRNQFRFIKFVKKKKMSPLTKTNREYCINITFPDWVIVKYIIPWNAIITFPEMMFSTITQSETVIFIFLYRILDLLFSTVLRLPW